MALILSIETSTKVCSVALCEHKKVLASKTINEAQFSHAENLNVFVATLFNETPYDFKNLDAVAISEGPGSYTGLRIGTSTAKGFCYALDIPLIAISTLKAMAMGALDSCDADFLAPMIDARRMEVFNAIYNRNLEIIKPISADVLEPDSYADILNGKSVAFFGDGSAKWLEACTYTNAHFIDVLPNADAMAVMAYDKYVAKDFCDMAYFEPFYLKDFVAGVKKPG